MGAMCSADLSEVIPRDDFAAGSGHEAGEDPDADARFEEVDGPIRKHRVGPTGVEAVDLRLIRTVDGTRPRASPVSSRAHNADQLPCGPGGFQEVDSGNRPARTPGFGP